LNRPVLLFDAHIESSLIVGENVFSILLYYQKWLDRNQLNNVHFIVVLKGWRVWLIFFLWKELIAKGFVKMNIPCLNLKIVIRYNKNKRWVELGICVLLDVLMYKISKYGILFCFCLLEVLELGKHISIWSLYGVWLCGVLFCFCLLEVQKLEKHKYLELESGWCLDLHFSSN
jgi:hypothetical protein